MDNTRYPMRAFYADGTSVVVTSADEELALRPGWEDTPAAFAPNYQRPAAASAFVPTANAQILQSLSEAEQHRMRAREAAAQPAQIPDSKLAAIELQFETHALEMIGLKARVGVLDTRVRELEALVASTTTTVGAVDLSGSQTSTLSAEDLASMVAQGAPETPAVEEKPKGRGKAK